MVFYAPDLLSWLPWQAGYAGCACCLSVKYMLAGWMLTLLAGLKWWLAKLSKLTGFLSWICWLALYVVYAGWLIRYVGCLAGHTP